MNESRGKLSPDKNFVTWPWYAAFVLGIFVVIWLTNIHVGNVPGDSNDTLMYRGVLYGNCQTHDSVPRYLECERLGVLSAPLTENTVTHDGVVYGECVGNSTIVELPSSSVRCFPVAVA